MAADAPLVTGLFGDRDSAERACQAVTERGYDKNDVNLAMADDTRRQYFNETTEPSELDTKAAEGAARSA